MDLVRSAPASKSPGNSANNSADNSADSLTGLAQGLSDLMDAYAGRSKRTPLQAYRSWSDRRTVVQGLITACFAVLVTSAMGLMFSTNGDTDVNAHQPQDPVHSPPRPLTFQAPGFILPPSGVFRPVDANPSGTNSSFAIEQSANQGSANHRSVSQASSNMTLKVVNPVGSHKWLKLLRASDESEILGLFVRSGDTVEIAVPPGAYRAKVASGQTWQGETARFGPQTQYFVSSISMPFKADPDRSTRIVVDLAPANVLTKNNDRLFNELDPASF
jgi:hypothetical protein